MERPYEDDEDELRRRRRRMRRRQEMRRRRRRRMLIRRTIKIGMAAAAIGILLFMIKIIWGKINPDRGTVSGLRQRVTAEAQNALLADSMSNGGAVNPEGDGQGAGEEEIR